MPYDGQPGTAKDGTPVLWVASLGRAVPVPAAKGLGVRAKPQGGGEQDIDPQAFHRSQDSVRAIDEAKDRTNWYRTGWLGGVTGGIPGSPAYNLDKDLDTLKARTAFEELSEMRRKSPTGGALGNVTEKELALLQAAEANLDVGQGEGQIDKNLDRLRSTVTSRTHGLDAANPIPLSAANQAKIPPGAYFRAPDGRVYQHKPGAGPAGQKSAGKPGVKSGYRILSVE